MESNIRTQKKESLKRAERRSKSRQNETTEQANNRKRIAAEKMAEKRKLFLQISKQYFLQKTWRKDTENWVSTTRE